MTEPSDHLLTVAQIAKELQVTPETVRRWIALKQLPGHKVSRRAGFRVSRRDFERFARGRDSAPPPPARPPGPEAAGNRLSDRVSAVTESGG